MLVLIAARTNTGNKLDARVVLILVSVGACLFCRLPAFPIELLVIMVALAVIERVVTVAAWNALGVLRTAVPTKMF